MIDRPFGQQCVVRIGIGLTPVFAIVPLGSAYASKMMNHNPSLYFCHPDTASAM